MSNRRTVSSSAYKTIKPANKDYQKSNYNNQTDNRENNKNYRYEHGTRKRQEKIKG